MTDEEIKKLKDKIDDGAAMAHDPMCSEGFEAAKKLIEFYEFKIGCYESMAMGIVTIQNATNKKEPIEQKRRNVCTPVKYYDFKGEKNE